MFGLAIKVFFLFEVILRSKYEVYKKTLTFLENKLLKQPLKFYIFLDDMRGKTLYVKFPFCETLY